MIYERFFLFGTPAETLGEYSDLLDSKNAEGFSLQAGTRDRFAPLGYHTLLKSVGPRSLLISGT